MANILPENETTTFEDQVYVNPETSLNEQNAFIDNLRATQEQRNQEVQQQTHDLGTDVPSNLGGLVGGEGYFTSRYQVPQTNSLVADLRATAQAQALSQVLQNQQDMWKKRYNDAYSAAQKRAAARANSGSPYSSGEQGESDATSSGTAYGQGAPASFPDPSEGNPGDTITRFVPAGSGGYYYDQDQNGNVVQTDDPSYQVWDDGYWHQGRQPVDSMQWYQPEKQRLEQGRQNWNDFWASVGKGLEDVKNRWGR